MRYTNLKNRLPALILVLALILSLVPGNLISQAFAVEASAVFVNGSASASGDGTSAETAVKTLPEAYALLDKSEGGTVVVCGLTKITENTDLEQFGIILSFTTTKGRCKDGHSTTHIGSKNVTVIHLEGHLRIGTLQCR